MKVNISVAARGRIFAKAIRRIRPILSGIGAEVEQIERSSPPNRDLLVLFTDDPSFEGCHVVSADAKQVQVSIGLGEYSSCEEDGSLIARTLDHFLEAIRLSDVMNEESRSAIEELFKRNHATGS